MLLRCNMHHCCTVAAHKQFAFAFAWRHGALNYQLKCQLNSPTSRTHPFQCVTQIRRHNATCDRDNHRVNHKQQRLTSDRAYNSLADLFTIFSKFFVILYVRMRLRRAAASYLITELYCEKSEMFGLCDTEGWIEHTITIADCVVTIISLT